MKEITVVENGLCMQFLVDDEERLLLGLVAAGEQTRPAGVNVHFPAVEVQTTGSGSTILNGAKHIHHACPDKPKYVMHEDVRNAHGRLVTFHLKSAELAIRVCYQFYDGIQTVRCHTEVENISDVAVGLEYVSSFSLTGLNWAQAADTAFLYLPHNSWCEELNFKRMSLREAGYNPIKMNHSTKRIAVTNTGAWSTKEFLPMAAVYDSERDETLFWQIEHNGSWHWEIADIPGGVCLRVSGPTEQENGWWKELSPGETFSSVPVAVAVAAGDFGPAVREMTKYRRCIVHEERLDRTMPVVFNDYMECLYSDPTTEKEWPLIEKAAALGAEIYCMDAGWYSTGDWWPLVGEWEYCEERFSGGIRQVFDHIRACGMRAGIWLEPEVMGLNCPLVPEFADCFFMRHGKPVVDNGRYQLDFRKQKVIDHLNSVVDRLIRDLGVSYFKFDYNIDPGVGTEVEADSFGDGLMQCNAAYLRWIDSLYERYPDLIIEHCSSGGMRMDYSSLAHFSLQSISDAAFYWEFAFMSVMASAAVLPEQAGIWVVPTVENTQEENAFAAVNAMLHRMYISGHTGRLDDANFALLKESVDVYKAIRHDLVNSLPYFPCGLCDFTNGWAVSARESGDGQTLYVTAGHLKGAENTCTVPLPDFAGRLANAQILYPQNVGEITLAADHLTVTLPEKSAALIKISL